MSTKKETLELNCEVTNFSILYEDGEILWHDKNAKLVIGTKDEKQTGFLKIWQENIKPEQINESRSLLEEKAESFLLGMKFSGNNKLTKSKFDVYYYIKNDDKLPAEHDMDIEAIIKKSKGEYYSYLHRKLPGFKLNGSIKSPPTPLPANMPNVPISLKRFILTIAQAEDLSEYPEYIDEKLKRWFLILEELEQDQKNPDFIDIRCARNFVSHNICDRKEVINFIKKELPSTVYLNSAGKEETKFLRHEASHIQLVSKYEAKARIWARNLVQQEIIKSGGCI